ncbi:orotidine-5'-phosphate decarboxylase [Gluconacetobacter diazotrophicus]|uniref:Orotidine 5'-phosphate decarboxylase n=1 Tax=Gluconacetobacter diazotrophicus (strain ATCC 49037 / DSM 5601 / CCUG 37298 / CIP 103539 / LMG 7603 / PAl5) TaxID=272568 RepID=A9HES3_GLUDA|nr:orotidine-5'-phosphate decarboxylase [Gluconacetobacter diazotrophicus]TWB11140.1 orotidine-5'-phosphate decarboxylase [Gluconacetobacter diazotrophicus]CAP55272.1 putative Orotidine 5'-phosphate decarboxylase [Gluconacetobacter diazotrophicus PA1 5]
MTARRTRLIVALDTKDTAQAARWRDQTAASADAVKLGLEFTYACGLDAVRQVAGPRSLFLDLKLHDIPNTVASAIGSLAATRPAMLTIHAMGGAAMIAAARQAVDRAFPPEARPLLLAVTVLTSMDADALHGIGIADDPCRQVLRLGALAMESGADGLVCSPREIAPLRDRLGGRAVLVVPGIRPEGAAMGDQKRVMTPAEASRAGADWIVVGRPITTAADPAAAAAAVAAELAG